MKRFVALIFIAGLCCAGWAQQPGEEQVWHDYLSWYRKQPPAAPVLPESFRKYLESAGVDPAEAGRRSAIVQRLQTERRSDLHPLFFDRTYAAASPRFNTRPNRTLVAAVEGVKPGRALDIHMGQGRNALYLASKGWSVTGFDFSAEGVRMARRTAARRGLKLTALVARHEDFDFGTERWDLIVMSYTWVPLTGPHIERILRSLKPRGRLVFEHLMNESDGSGAGPWIPRPNELLTVFGGLRILRYEDVRAPADWSWRPERIARLVAEKSLRN